MLITETNANVRRPFVAFRLVQKKKEIITCELARGYQCNFSLSEVVRIYSDCHKIWTNCLLTIAEHEHHKYSCSSAISTLKGVCCRMQNVK